VKAIEKLPGIRELALQFISYGNEAELKAQLVTATLERCCLLEPLPADADSFAKRCQEAKPRITLVAQELMRLTGQLIAEHATLTKRVAGLKTFPEVVADINAQVARLMPKNFPGRAALRAHRPDPALPQGGHRAHRQAAHQPRPRRRADGRLEAPRPAFEREWLAKAKAGVTDPQLEEFRWLLEELRVGLFAQELKTPMPVSVKRLQKIWDSRPR
jgi:ATP-dependent helicase HrpA